MWIIDKYILGSLVVGFVAQTVVHSAFKGRIALPTFVTVGVLSIMLACAGLMLVAFISMVMNRNRLQGAVAGAFGSLAMAGYFFGYALLLLYAIEIDDLRLFVAFNQWLALPLGTITCLGYGVHIVQRYLTRKQSD